MDWFLLFIIFFFVNKLHLYVLHTYINTYMYSSKNALCTYFKIPIQKNMKCVRKLDMRYFAIFKLLHLYSIEN